MHGALDRISVRLFVATRVSIFSSSEICTVKSIHTVIILHLTRDVAW